MSNRPESSAVAKMQRAGIGESEIASFVRVLRRVVAGEKALLPEETIEPLSDPDHLDEIENIDVDSDALKKTAVLKLNGGIGTTMGLKGPKSLLEAHGGKSFLDIAILQIQRLRATYGAELPFILLNSTATQSQTNAALQGRGLEVEGLPLSVLQTVVPRLDPVTLEPIEWPLNSSLEWAPPGHGDLYGVLIRSGLLYELLERGYRYLFVANADNLGAVPDPRIATWFQNTGADFAAEVVRRDAMDVKGGHFARHRESGTIVLRELAQTPPEDLHHFQNVQRHPFLNTNNLWINLESLREVSERGGPELPLIVNRKIIDPSVDQAPAIIQLESAMGSAIGSFAHSELLEVDNTRFIPVKKMADLLLLRSDAFELNEEGRLIDRCETRPIVSLDDEYFSRFEDFSARVPQVPSLVQSRSLTVRGDVVIPEGYVARGDAVIKP
ncbi:UTP--glucose-1-phosphate uridylyltransferase [Actinomycetaceae bacterium L2_0104]